MPFLSKAQRRWMYANKPEMAKEWEDDTPTGRLPERLHSKSTSKTRIASRSQRRIRRAWRNTRR
jgi:hypothetical protein